VQCQRFWGCICLQYQESIIRILKSTNLMTKVVAFHVTKLSLVENRFSENGFNFD